jgi:hypothetical protein
VAPYITIRAGILTFRAMATYLGYEFDPDPAPDDPISVTRQQWDAACAYMAESGVPLRPDRDQAWRDFVGWRVNYDVLIEGAAVVLAAPVNPWDHVVGSRPTFTTEASRGGPPTFGSDGEGR